MSGHQASDEEARDQRTAHQRVYPMDCWVVISRTRREEEEEGMRTSAVVELEMEGYKLCELKAGEMM